MAVYGLLLVVRALLLTPRPQSRPEGAFSDPSPVPPGQIEGALTFRAGGPGRI